MPNSWFDFKRFRVEQSGSAMKVGTDGVLLGAWMTIECSHRRYLDIGTGTGVIAIMVAQRVSDTCYAECGEVVIDAAEVDAESASQARHNADVSPWREMINVHYADIRTFTGNSVPIAVNNDKTEQSNQVGIAYDHIFSNPPWFVDSLESPVAKRTLARHTAALSYGELLDRAAALLVANGLLSVVLPSESGDEFAAMAAGRGLSLSRRTVVRTLPAAKPKRVLMEFRKSDMRCGLLQDELSIETGVSVGDYTPEYRALTKDFYLKF